MNQLFTTVFLLLVSISGMSSPERCKENLENNELKNVYECRPEKLRIFKRISANTPSFKTSRPTSYYLSLGGSFKDRNEDIHYFDPVNNLMLLKSDDQILDLGSGEGFAAEGFLHSFNQFWQSTMDYPEVKGMDFFLPSFIVYLIKNYDFESKKFKKGASEFKEWYDKATKIIQFYKRKISDRPQIVGFSYKMQSRKIPNKLNKLKFITGHFFEEVDLSKLGKSKLVFDYFGVFNYTLHPDYYLFALGSLLTSDGIAYIASASIEELEIHDRASDEIYDLTDFINKYCSGIHAYRSTVHPTVVVKRVPGTKLIIPKLSSPTVKESKDKSGAPERKVHIIKGSYKL